MTILLSGHLVHFTTSEPETYRTAKIYSMTFGMQQRRQNTALVEGTGEGSSE